MKIRRFSPAAWLGVGLIVGGLTSCNNDDVFDPIEQFNKEQQQIDDYLAESNLTAKEDTLGYGLKYIILEQGTGEKPNLDQVVLVDYEGTILSTGEVIDENDSVHINLGRVIVGWRILLPHLRQGGEILMFIPSAYAYGQNATGDVPANTALIFKVKLREIKSQFDYEQQRIEQYLEENELVAETDTLKGLRYIITEEGDGESPEPDETVNVDYEGRFLANDESFDSRNEVNFDLDNLIEGWSILMPYVKEGGSITMFIPSKYGYGATGNSNGTIPPYATLIFEVKLNEIK